MSYWTSFPSTYRRIPAMHGIDEIEDFREWYAQDIGGLESLKPMRLFLIGLGTDDRTERMVRFLARQQWHGHITVDLSRLSPMKGRPYLPSRLKLVEAIPLKATDRRPTNKGCECWTERRATLERWIDRIRALSEQFAAVRNMFTEGSWPESIHKSGTNVWYSVFGST